MATTEDVIILKVGTDQAVKSVGDLKNNIKELKKQLDGYKEATGEVDEQGKKVYKTIEGLAIGTEEYKEALEELKINQNALRDAMYATTASMEDVSKAAMGTSESYNSLVHRMAALKEEWRATNDEARRNELGTQIGEINDKLKGMDSSVGNFQRNVGNYSSALSGLEKGFVATAGGASSMINPLKSATAGLYAMSATPVIAILGLLANIIMKVMENLESSEERTRAMTEAFAVFNVVGKAVDWVLGQIANAIAAVGEGITWLLDKLGLVTDEMKQMQALAKEETRLLKLQRDNIYKNADAELEVAKLKKEAADKSKYTAEERIALLEEAAKIEEETAQRALEAAELEYNIIKQRNALTESSTEDLNAEADAYAKLVKAQTDYFNKTKELTSQISEARATARREALEAAKALSSAEIELLEAELLSTKIASEERLKIEKDILDKRYAQEVANAKNTIKDRRTLQKTLLALEKTHLAEEKKLEEEHSKSLMEIQRQRMENKMNVYTSGTKDYLKAQKDLRKWEMDNLVQEAEETDAQFNARRLAAQRAYYESVAALNQRIIADGRLTYETMVANAAEGSEAQLEAIVFLKKYELELLQQQMGETDAEFKLRQLQAQKELNDALQALANKQYEDSRLAYENAMNENRDRRLVYLQKQIELKKFELDSVHKLEEESDAEFKARMLQKEQEYTDAKREYTKEILAMTQNLATGVSGLLGSIADAYESDSDAAEKNAKQIKNLRIAGATIDMLNGIVGAISSSAGLGPVGWAMGAIQAATITATGIANINKIKSQKVSKNGDGGSTQTPAAVTAPNIDTNLTSVRTITSASEEERLNRMASPQKVYILQSDIEAAGSQSKTQIEESSF